MQRDGAALNMVLVDGVFEEVPGQGDADADVQSSPSGIIFHSAGAIDEAAVAQVQADLRRRILRAFGGRGLLESCDAKDMLAYQHSGFSVDAGVCIEAHDRPAWSGCCAIAPDLPLPWSAFAKRALSWCTAVPNSTASLALTNVAPRLTNCTSRHWR